MTGDDSGYVRHLTGLFDDADSLEDALGTAFALVLEGRAQSRAVIPELAAWLAAQQPTDDELDLAISDPNAYVARGGTLGLEDYETLTVWQRRAVRAVLDGQPRRT